MLIDTNIFLEVLLAQEKLELCNGILEEIESGEKKAAITSFTIDSIIIIMNRNKASISDIEIFIRSILSYNGLIFYQITFKDRLLALKWMKKYNLDYEDALTLQSAISLKEREILSLDSDFDKVKEIERIVP